MPMQNKLPIHKNAKKHREIIKHITSSNLFQSSDYVGNK